LHDLWTKTFQSTLALFAITTVIAVVAAFIKMVIGLASGNGLAWVTFFQDFTENFFIAAVIVYITAVIADYQNRARIRREQSTYVLQRVETIAQVIGLPSGIGKQKDLLENPQGSDIINMLTIKTDRWRDLGKNFRELTEARADLDSKPGPSAAVQNLAHKQAILFRMMWRDVSSHIRVLYAADGERKQRATYLRFLVDDLAVITAANEGKLAAEAERCRELAIGLIARTQYTDALVESCLVFDLLAPPGSAARAVFGPYQDDLAALARIRDPVKGLIAYCDKALDIIEHEQDYRTLLSSIFASVARALQALDLELTYASLLGKALASLLETAVPAGGCQ
jgi:hypothetical protein